MALGCLGKVLDLCVTACAPANKVLMVRQMFVFSAVCVKFLCVCVNIRRVSSPTDGVRFGRGADRGIGIVQGGVLKCAHIWVRVRACMRVRVCVCV